MKCMTTETNKKAAVPEVIHIKFPGDIDYIPPIRKFISDLLNSGDFSDKFAYRSEIIVDELCNNAITFGCTHVGAEIELLCSIFPDRIEIELKDEGGNEEDLIRLKTAINNKNPIKRKISKTLKRKNLGLEIVRMLSEELNFSIGEDNVTSIRVVRKRSAESQPN